ncbi:hypothetical protein ACWEWU_13885 [Staphylococcus xylosus]
MTKQVTFNDWEFQVDTKVDYDILTSNDKLVVLDDTNDNSIQISYLNYGSKLSINNQNNKLVLEIPYFGEEVIQ